MAKNVILYGATIPVINCRCHCPPVCRVIEFQHCCSYPTEASLPYVSKLNFPPLYATNTPPHQKIAIRYQQWPLSVSPSLMRTTYLPGFCSTHFMTHGSYSSSSRGAIVDTRREMNWWQHLCLPVGLVDIPPPPVNELLSQAQIARLDFYRVFLKTVRRIGAATYIAIPPDSEQPAAVLSWLPAKARPSIFDIVLGGFATSVLRLGGLRGAFNVWSYQKIVDSLFATYLSSPVAQGAYVQILGTDPAQSGHRYAEQLLTWQLAQHQKAEPTVPVYIETNTEYAQRIYERVGFRELGRAIVETGTNADGYQVGKKLQGQELEAVNNRHVSRAMVFDRGPKYVSGSLV